jgi:vacuolar protein sorting-associated protein 13A/C
MTFEEIDVKVVTTFSFTLRFEGVGISVVNQKMNELVYVSFRGLELRYTDSTTNYKYSLICQWIQIDNQLFGGVFPIILYPTKTLKSEKDLEATPNLQLEAVVLKEQGMLIRISHYTENIENSKCM